MNTPSYPAQGQAEYPFSVTDSTLTLNGISLQLPPVAGNPIVMFDDLVNVGDRIAMTLMNPIAPGPLVVALDDITGNAWNTVELDEVLEMTPTYQNGLGRALIVGGGGGFQVWLDEARFADSSAISSFCGSDGASSACPCANEGGVAQGCANSTWNGASLSGSGSASMASDSLTLTARQLPPNTPTLLFAGSSMMAPGSYVPYSHGLRCVGGPFSRVSTMISGPDGSARWENLVSGTASAPGSQLYFQVWYADANGPCGGSGANMTPGVAVTVAP